MKTQGSQSTLTVKALMNAFPAPLFIVDGDLRVHDMNAGAGTLVGTPRDVLGKTLCGTVLRCAHLTGDTSAVCGHTPHCARCTIRRSVEESDNGQDVVRRWSHMQLMVDGGARSFAFLVSVSALDVDGGDRFLLALEDVTEIVELRRLLPVCSGCGSVRSDDNYWQSVEQYLHRHTAVRFSHGLCPDCMQKMYGHATDAD